MPLNRQRAQKYLQKFDFASLFIEELGWDMVDRVTLPFEVDGEPFEVVAIAQKRGFIVYQCIMPEIPARPLRVKLDRQLTDYSKSHLLVFGDEGKTQQTWMWVRQELGKPLAPRFEQYQVGQTAERLLQKLEALAIAFAEAEKLTLVEVAQRIKKAFEVEKVTKKFFTRFEKEHGLFLTFIDGIQSEFDRTWYALLMLNRLMFVYFIQKKNFLDGDINYLRHRLKRCQAQWGTDTFHSFYRQFLLKLFHEGLGKPDRNPELDKLLGKIPYLNGGLFEVHQLEEKYDSTLQIPDAAFEQVFNFFDEYDWHLDDRPLRNQNEINPDVLGYIFEKYINQKQMGAYYTKEDITEYISKNTIIPFLFDAAKKRYPAAFRPHPLTPSPPLGEGEQEIPAPLSPLGRGAGGEGNSGQETTETNLNYWEISPVLRQQMTEVARPFRQEPTQSEAILWQALRGRKLEGRKFKRQQPIGAFVVDFFCGAERLVVEVDGTVHETQQEYDQQRQELLESLELRFIRVSSQQVETNLDQVLETIRAAFRPHPLAPSPKEGEGEQDGSAPLSPPGRGAGGEGNSGCEGSIWQLLQENPDRYIYEAVRQGVDLELPAEIAAGIEDVSQRGGWNKPAAEGFALPTETWREHVARRKRCLELRQKLAAGAVTQINDLITYNLDIRQFAQDVITSCESSDLLKALYQAIEQVSVLDPTCGSGAFLFAALNILEPLYTACLERMQGFVDEDDLRLSPHPLTPSPKQGEGEPDSSLAPLSRSGRGAGGEGKPRYEYFRKVLAEMAKHPNPRYFVLKSIMLNNLYGVDIMEEATEICKLRLFLKLVAQMEAQPKQANFGLEPLPDIAFNIRAGNTLVGFASLDEVRKAITQDEVTSKKIKGKSAEVEADQIKLDLQDDASRINEKAKLADRAFQRFRQMQTEFGMDAGDFRAAKQEPQQRLVELNEELNHYLAREYGVDVNKTAAFEKWRDSHQPFHWFVEFYSIIDRGGFDVIIGNPPYVEWSKIKNYMILLNQYSTQVCGNIYTTICEQSYKLLQKFGTFGMIVPMSCISTERMQAFRDIWNIHKLTTYISNYSGDAHPSVLFEGVKFRLSILIQSKSHESKIYSTHFYKWLSEARRQLFPLIEYNQVIVDFVRNGLIPKITEKTYSSILSKCLQQKKKIGDSISKEYSYTIYSHRIVAHFVKAFDFIPFFSNERDGIKKSEDYKAFSIESKIKRDALTVILNSNTFYIWFAFYSDVYHCGREIILDFPCDLQHLVQCFGQQLSAVNSKLMEDFKKNSVRRTIPYKTTGIVEYNEYYPRVSKLIIDEIDRVLAQHYGFTDEELDFILNYDIKYRMGRDNGGDG